MTEQSQARTEVIQGVVDRVSSYQDGATETTVEDELKHGFGEAGVDVADDQVSALAAAIEENGGEVDAAAVIGG